MGSAQCRTCRDDKDKEMEIQPEVNRLPSNHEKGSNLKEDICKNIKSSNKDIIVIKDPDTFLNKNKNSGEVTILSNFEINKFKSNQSIDSKSESEDIENRESEVISSQNISQYSKQNSESKEQSKIPPISGTNYVKEDYPLFDKAEHLENFENSIDSRKRENNKNESSNFIQNNKTQKFSKIPNKLIAGGGLEEKEKLISYDNKMDLINISKIDYVSFSKEQECELKAVDENYQSKDTKLKLKMKSNDYGNHLNSNLNISIDQNNLPQNLNPLTKSGNFYNYKSIDKKCRGDNSYVSNIKKSNFQKDNLDAWKDVSIFSIVSENVLINCDYDDVLYQSELMKYTYNKMYKKQGQLYSSKFCVLTKAQFKIFRSKEAFLMLQNPITRVPIFHILDSNRFNMTTSNKKKLFNFYVELNENYASEEFSKYGKDNCNKTCVESNEKEAFNNKLRDKDMEDGVNENLIKMKKRKKENKDDVRENRKENQLIDEEVLNNPKFIILASENDDLVNRWVCIINYFISK